MKPIKKSNFIGVLLLGAIVGFGVATYQQGDIRRFFWKPKSIHQSVLDDDSESIKWNLYYGTKIDLRSSNYQNQLPIEIAVANQKIGPIKILIRNGAVISPELIEQTESILVKNLLKCSLDNQDNTLERDRCVDQFNE